MSARLDQLLSAEDVAGLFKIKVRLLYDQRYRSEPPGALGITVGGHVRWDPADIHAYIDAQKQNRPDRQVSGPLRQRTPRGGRRA